MVLKDTRPGKTTGTQAELEMGTKCERSCISSCVSSCFSRRRGEGAFPRGVVPGCVLLTVINLDHGGGTNFEASRRKRMVLEE